MVNATTAERFAMMQARLTNGDLMVLLTALGDETTAGTPASGGSYANQPITWDFGTVSNFIYIAADITFTLPTANLMGWEVWDSTLTDRRWFGVFDNQDSSASASTDRILCGGHGYVDGDPVAFGDGASIGLGLSTVYYVINSTADDFQVATTVGGTAVDLTDDVSGDALQLGRVIAATSGDTVTFPAGNCDMAIT